MFTAKAPHLKCNESRWLCRESLPRLAYAGVTAQTRAFDMPTPAIPALPPPPSALTLNGLAWHCASPTRRCARF